MGNVLACPFSPFLFSLTFGGDTQGKASSLTALTLPLPEGLRIPRPSLLLLLGVPESSETILVPQDFSSQISTSHGKDVTYTSVKSSFRPQSQVWEV
ncbi:hypothetical protein XENTR_v10007350 [Xenopus tropicalis]|nr:hypothetical protein XENTR_v10007350 [Xenopus tropicalis]